MKVLIVDDEPAVCRLLRHLIRWEELDMTLSGFVYDGQEALELLDIFPQKNEFLRELIGYLVNRRN